MGFSFKLIRLNYLKCIRNFYGKKMYPEINNSVRQSYADHLLIEL